MLIFGYLLANINGEFSLRRAILWCKKPEAQSTEKGGDHFPPIDRTNMYNDSGCVVLDGTKLGEPVRDVRRAGFSTLSGYVGWVGR